MNRMRIASGRVAVRRYVVNRDSPSSTMDAEMRYAYRPLALLYAIEHAACSMTLASRRSQLDARITSE